MARWRSFTRCRFRFSRYRLKRNRKKSGPDWSASASASALPDIWTPSLNWINNQVWLRPIIVVSGFVILAHASACRAFFCCGRKKAHFCMECAKEQFPPPPLSPLYFSIFIRVTGACLLGYRQIFADVIVYIFAH